MRISDCGFNETGYHLSQSAFRNPKSAIVKSVRGELRLERAETERFVDADFRRAARFLEPVGQACRLALCQQAIAYLRRRFRKSHRARLFVSRNFDNVKSIIRLHNVADCVWLEREGRIVEGACVRVARERPQLSAALA